MFGVSSQPDWASLARTEGLRMGGGLGEGAGLERGGDATSSLGNSEALASCGMQDFVRHLDGGSKSQHLLPLTPKKW